MRQAADEHLAQAGAASHRATAAEQEAQHLEGQGKFADAAAAALQADRSALLPLASPDNSSSTGSPANARRPLMPSSVKSNLSVAVAGMSRALCVGCQLLAYDFEDKLC